MSAEWILQGSIWTTRPYRAPHTPRLQAAGHLWLTVSSRPSGRPQSSTAAEWDRLHPLDASPRDQRAGNSHAQGGPRPNKPHRYAHLPSPWRKGVGRRTQFDLVIEGEIGAIFPTGPPSTRDMAPRGPRHCPYIMIRGPRCPYRPHSHRGPMWIHWALTGPEEEVDRRGDLCLVPRRGSPCHEVPKHVGFGD
jgi:hypothetical protein